MTIKCPSHQELILLGVSQNMYLNSTAWQTNMLGLMVKPKHIHIYVCQNTHTHTHTNIHEHIYIYMYVCVYIYIYMVIFLRQLAISGNVDLHKMISMSFKKLITIQLY